MIVYNINIIICYETCYLAMFHYLRLHTCNNGTNCIYQQCTIILLLKGKKKHLESYIGTPSYNFFLPVRCLVSIYICLSCKGQLQAYNIILEERSKALVLYAVCCMPKYY